ncbi:hypothetical protein PN462_15650 [Spirulina sp. CS-785/01]|uniref:ribonuclease III domain-containing protein n=1 Tax=Spirulina sp. CS-785/01 TaxID=3021716 RepID=UPI00232B4E20|nr:ribonuclease III domain-containing protein [Spirulina sp. CS-785/01]MDB9314545.1 hypothetical protein [Spirulina sp. CS-785/01]
MLDWKPEVVESQIGINFKDYYVLFAALSDISYAKQIEDVTASNERLAFLGEDVLKFTIADYIYQSCPYLQVSNYQGLMVKLTERERLTKTWFQLGLGESYPFLVNTEERAILRKKKNNPFEKAFLALVGAIHDDRGFSQARNWLVKYLIMPLLQKYLKDTPERAEPELQIKFLGNTLLSSLATDYIYHLLPGVEVKRLSQFQRKLISKTEVKQYKDHSIQLGNDQAVGFKQFLGEQYLIANEQNNRTAFRVMRDWWVKEFLEEEEILKGALSQLLKDGMPQKWIIRTVLGYSSKDYDAGRDRFHELMDEG